MEMEKLKYMLGIEILRNSSQKNVIRGTFKGLCVQKMPRQPAG